MSATELAAATTLTRPCGCLLQGSVVIHPCKFCKGMTESMDAEVARWRVMQPGYRVNTD